MARYTIDNQYAPIDFEATEDVRRTLQNAKNLLMIRMGEVPYDRYRGFDHALFDLPLQEMGEKLLPELDRVMLWEPDAEVVDGHCAHDGQGGTIITATIEVDIDEGV